MEERPILYNCSDSNISELRDRYPDGLHFVVGDTHGEAKSLKKLLSKIKYCPEKDHLYFVGDYNGGYDEDQLLNLMSLYYQADCNVPGFHLIRGNHEREIMPMYALDNLPDIIVVRGSRLNYFIVHAGMVKSVFRLICEDMDNNPDRNIFMYRLDEYCALFPTRQVFWSVDGTYGGEDGNNYWPHEEDLKQRNVCIIHGHTPYDFLKPDRYGDVNMFYKKQRVWFSEDLQAFDIDSDIKGRMADGTDRHLSCVCMEALDEIASQPGEGLSIAALKKGPNAVFSVSYKSGNVRVNNSDISRILDARVEMKTISSTKKCELFFKE